MRKVSKVAAGVSLVIALAAANCVYAADDTLIAAAQKEGRVTWYTTQIVDQFAAPVAKAFEKKYGIKVDYVRADPNSLVLRIWNEAKAGRLEADVFDGAPTVTGLKKVGLVEPWVPDGAARLPPRDYDPKGNWVATNIYVLTPAYNTNLVPKGTEPRTFADLLEPRWKGRMAWASSTFSAPGFIGLVLASMGEDQGLAYLRRLAGQNIVNLNVSAREVLDQTIAGEYPLALATFNYHSVISAAQDAPVAWIPMNPSLAYFSVTALVKGAPHPAAAKLFIDFLISEDGQRLVRDADYIPVDPAVPPRDESLRPDGTNFTAIFFTPEDIAAKMSIWLDIFKDLFR